MGTPRMARPRKLIPFSRKKNHIGRGAEVYRLLAGRSSLVVQVEQLDTFCTKVSPINCGR